MTNILRPFWIGGLGYLVYRLWKHNGSKRHAAYADDQVHFDHKDVRDAGPGAMRDPPKDEWTDTDEALDESFPASDPPGRY